VTLVGAAGPFFSMLDGAPVSLPDGTDSVPSGGPTGGVGDGGKPEDELTSPERGCSCCLPGGGPTGGVGESNSLPGGVPTGRFTPELCLDVLLLLVAALG
jgi:hypothetical protein